MNTETEAVDGIDETADLATSFLEPEKWVPIHIHRDDQIPEDQVYVGAGRFASKSRPAPRPFTAAFVVFATAICVAGVSFALALAVLGVRFLAGAFS